MALRLSVARPTLEWLAEQSGAEPSALRKRYPRWDAWLAGTAAPTFIQAQELARYAGVPFGYLLLSRPPALKLPVSDFREGFAGDLGSPSPDLLAVVHQSIRRQDWYRDFARDNGLPTVSVVGAGAGQSPEVAAADMLKTLRFEVPSRRGSWTDTRRHLLKAFEDLGGLTVATSMVDNNTRRLLDPDEFRGFALVDDLAPLVFVNTRQTLNGQIFTLAHEYAHIWLGRGGISLEDPQWEPKGSVERWCNVTASEFLVPRKELARQYATIADLPLTEQLDDLAGVFKCGTLVILQALRRHNLRELPDFTAQYEAEKKRLQTIIDNQPSGGGDFYRNQPYRIGERFSRAIVSDAIEGRTSLTEAIRLTSLGSLSAFDKYAATLGVR